MVLVELLQQLPRLARLPLGQKDVGQQLVGPHVVGIQADSLTQRINGPIQLPAPVQSQSGPVEAFCCRLNAVQFLLHALERLVFGDPAAQQFDAEAVATGGGFDQIPFLQEVGGILQFSDDDAHAALAQQLFQLFLGDGAWAGLSQRGGHHSLGRGQPVPQPLQRVATGPQCVGDGRVHICRGNGRWFVGLLVVSPLPDVGAELLGQEGMAAGQLPDSFRRAVDPDQAVVGLGKVHQCGGVLPAQQ